MGVVVNPSTSLLSFVYCISDLRQADLFSSSHYVLLYIEMAQVDLPKRLMNFFTKYPPKLYSAKYTGSSFPLTKPTSRIAEAQAAISYVQTTSEVPILSSTPSENPGAPMVETSTTIPNPVPRSERGPPNPFLPMKNHETGRWRGAAIGLRVQADLVKLAKAYGVEALLPPGRKSTVFKEQRTLEQGLRVRGTGEGQKVKGHKWERRMGAKLDVRRKAMENMPELIREWQQRGHGRGWKKYPK